MSESGIAVEEIARLAGHSSSRTTEVVYRHELRPVITTGADAMDKIFRYPDRGAVRSPWPWAASERTGPAAQGRWATRRE
jgi:hypothetical protein